jgi:hypothetical protein
MTQIFPIVGELSNPSDDLNKSNSKNVPRSHPPTTLQQEFVSHKPGCAACEWKLGRLGEKEAARRIDEMVLAGRRGAGDGNLLEGIWKWVNAGGFVDNISRAFSLVDMRS